MIMVRDAHPGDGAALARIHGEMAAFYAALAPEHFHTPDLDGFAEEIDAALAAPRDHTRQIVAEVDGDVAGAVIATIVAPDEGAEREISPDLARTRVRIDYVAVAERHRRGGVGGRLVQEAQEWGRERGATVAETTTYRRSPLAMPFWERGMGYEERAVSLRKPL